MNFSAAYSFSFGSYGGYGSGSPHTDTDEYEMVDFDDDTNYYYYDDGTNDYDYYYTHHGGGAYSMAFRRLTASALAVTTAGPGPTRTSTR